MERHKKAREDTNMPQLKCSTDGGCTKRRWNAPDISPNMFRVIFMISVFNICLCTAREIHVAPLGRKVIVAENFASNSLQSVHSSNASVSSESKPISEWTWVVEKKDCGKLDNGCFCESRANNWTSVRCRCDNEARVVHLKAPEMGSNIKQSSLFLQKERWTWRFEQCSQMILHSRFLGTVDGSHFDVEFHNISSMTISESAFATRDSYSSHANTNHVSILFNQCKIERLQTKTFPSYINSITFTRCNIKSLAPRFIHALKMDKVRIESSKIHDIESEAFYSQTIIDTLNIDNSHIHSIHSNGVASAINKMSIVNSAIDQLQQEALSGSVATVTLQNCKFAKVESSGFIVNTWSKVTLLNNTFASVARKGFDLSQFSEMDQFVEIEDNSWGKVERDFISTGSGDKPFIRVSSNTFLQQCDCGNTFASYLTQNGSRPWFHQELLNNSRCPVNEQVLTCLLNNGHVNSTNSNLLPYDALNLLCDTDVYMCMNGVSEVDVSTDETNPGRPPLPNRLRVLAYFIAAMGVFIIASLLITMCVFLCRRKTPRKKSPSDSPIHDLENAQGQKTAIPKSMSGGEYADIVFKHSNSATRPRSMLLEDVEMEDKGVQTMPTELSSEVLEGLREKLSRPDSFWDAKETIDHLYDLIQVKELNSALSSPPDVTMCNTGDSTTASTARLLPSASSSPVAQVTSAGVSVSIGGSDSQLLQTSNISNDSSPVSDTPPPLPSTSPPSGVPHLQRYAQIKNKAKTAPLCEYADPSDSSMHIYSELTPHPQPNGNESIPTMSTSNGNKASPTRNPQCRELPPLKSSFLTNSRNQLHNSPILCEYTEPKDVQTHVYAELSNNPQQKNHKSKSATSSPIKGSNVKGSPSKQPHCNTITIAVPPPPINNVNIPYSSSFHSSPRHLANIRENELSSSNPALATKSMSPVKIIHVNGLEASDGKSNRFSPEKLKRSASHADASYRPRGGSALSPSFRDSATGTSDRDTQKRPLPSIPSWSSQNEGKSQL